MPFFFVSRGLNKTLPLLKPVACQWAGSQRTLKGLQQGLQRDERMTWKESRTLVHMVRVNNSPFSAVNHAASAGPHGFSSHKGEIKEGAGWGLKLWDSLFYFIYHIICSSCGGIISRRAAELLSWNHLLSPNLSRLSSALWVASQGHRGWPFGKTNTHC